MALEQIMLFITQQGPAMVIAGVVIYCMLRFADIAFDYMKNKIATEQNKTLDQRNDVSLEIQMLIDRTLVDTDSNRILLFEFHNSVSNLSGLHFSYMTCTYESTKKGMNNVGQSLGGIPTTLYTTFFDNLQTKQHLLLDSEKPNYELVKSGYDLLTFQNESKALFFILRDVNQRPKGCVAIFKSNEFSEDNIRLTGDISGRLGSLLAFSKGEKNAKK